MRPRIVILGGGTGGTLDAQPAAPGLRRLGADITVVDRDDRHVYQPGLLFVPFGLAEPGGDRPVSPRAAARRRRLPPGRGRPRRDRARTWSISSLAGRSSLRRAGDRHRRRAAARGDRGPDRSGLEERSFTFYTLDGATALRDALRAFDARAAGRERRRHADQVPGRAARVLLPGRLVPAASAASATTSSSLTSPRSTARSRSPSPPRTSPGCSQQKGIDDRDRVRHRPGRRRRRAAGQLGRARGPVRPARHDPAARRGRVSSGARPGSATSSASCPPTRARCRPRPRRTSS